MGEAWTARVAFDKPGLVGDGGVDAGLIVVGKRLAVCNCFVVDGVDARRAVQTLLNEGVCPGDAVFLVVVLLVERRVGVDHIAHHVAVLAAHGVIGFLIEIVHHGRCELVTAHGCGGRVTGKIAAGQHGEKGDNGNYQYKADDADGPFQTLAHTLFLGCGGGFAGSDLLLALVLFARCAHFRIIPLVYSCFARRRHSTYYTEKATYLQAFLSEIQKFVIFPGFPREPHRKPEKQPRKAACPAEFPGMPVDKRAGFVYSIISNSVKC